MNEWITTFSLGSCMNWSHTRCSQNALSLLAKVWGKFWCNLSCSIGPMKRESFIIILTLLIHQHTWQLQCEVLRGKCGRDRVWTDRCNHVSQLHHLLFVWLWLHLCISVFLSLKNGNKNHNKLLRTGLVSDSQDWKRSVFIPTAKKGNAKECSNYPTIALISHASKIILKILQARVQQYVNWELPDVQAGFRKGRGTRDQIVNICWIIEKAREFQKNIFFCLIDYTKVFDCVDHENSWST